MGDVIALIDMDCFFVQVKQRSGIETRGLPCAVSQYTGGGLLASNYIARRYGVKKTMKLVEAKKLCPNIIIFYVNEKDGKCDLSEFRNASDEVFQIIGTFTSHYEKSSIDEAFICLNSLVDVEIKTSDMESLAADIVSKTVVLSDPPVNSDEFYTLLQRSNQYLRLAIGADISSRIREAIFVKTGFTCSVGIAENKTLAKLVSNMHKPNRQTLLLSNYVTTLLNNTDIQNIRNLGGKLGQNIKSDLNVNYIGELKSISREKLINLYGHKRGEWIYNICRGVSHEQVTVRHMSKSIGCSKQLENRVTKINQVKERLGQFSDELYGRLCQDMDNYKRYPTAFVIGLITRKGDRHSRTTNFGKMINKTVLPKEEILTMAYDTLKIFNKSTNDITWEPAISTIFLYFNKFEPLNDSSCTTKRTNNTVPNMFSTKEKRNNAEVSKPSKDNNSAGAQAGFLDPMNTIACEKCSKILRYDEIFEHEDYHSAIDLHNALNNTSTFKNNIGEYFK